MPACVYSFSQYFAIINDVFDGFIGIPTFVVSLVVNVVTKDVLLVVPIADYLVLDDHYEFFSFRK